MQSTCISKSDYQHTGNIIHDRKRRQKYFEPCRNSLPERSQNGERKSYIRRNRNPPASCRNTGMVQRIVNECGRHGAAESSQERKERTAERSEVSADDVTFY